MRSRLARALDVQPEHGGISSVIEQLASATAVATLAAERWFAAPAGKEPRSAAEGVAAPGWRFERGGTAVVYRAPAHADPFLRSLLDVLAPRADRAAAGRRAADVAAFRRYARTAVFRDLTSKQSGGALYAACLRCHATDSAGSAFRVRWRSVDRVVTHNGLTSFDHGSHAAALGPPRECSACHVMTSAGTAEAQDAAASGLAAIRKDSCITCHSAERAPATCLTCHRYHASP